MFLRIFVIIVVLGLLIGGGYWFWQSRSETTITESEITPTPAREEATPTPEEEVEKDAFSIEIQNGSGIAGEAGRAQELLEGDDFTVSGTANADNYDYEETVIQATSDVPDSWIDQLIATLEQNYTVQTRVDEIEGDSGADVIVIVGQLDENGDTMVVEEEETESEDPTPTSEEGSEDTEDESTVTPTPSPEE